MLFQKEDPKKITLQIDNITQKNRAHDSINSLFM